MKKDLYDRLVAVYGTRETAEEMVNLYAEGSLSEEAAAAMDARVGADPELEAEAASLKWVVDQLRSDPGPVFTEESYQRILIKLQQKGAEIPPAKTTPAFWQYQLPIQG